MITHRIVRPSLGKEQKAVQNAGVPISLDISYITTQWRCIRQRWG